MGKAWMGRSWLFEVMSLVGAAVVGRVVDEERACRWVKRPDTRDHRPGQAYRSRCRIRGEERANVLRNSLQQQGSHGEIERTELVLDALNMALWRRRPQEVIHHSDQGSQYTSIAFGSRCKEAGVRPSMGSAGDCYDNALCESFFATLECELIERSCFHTHAEARTAIFEYIEGWYNPHRRHSAINYESPMNFERQSEIADVA